MVVIRSPGGDVELKCGGVAMLGTDAGAPTALDGNASEGSVALGKRYVDGSETIEVLCTKAGAGALALGDAQLHEKTAKPLPSSD